MSDYWYKATIVFDEDSGAGVDTGQRRIYDYIEILEPWKKPTSIYILDTVSFFFLKLWQILREPVLRVVRFVLKLVLKI